MCHFDIDNIVDSHHRLHLRRNEVGQVRYWRIIEVDSQFATQTGYQPLQDDDVGQSLGESLRIVKENDVVRQRRQFISGVKTFG